MEINNNVRTCNNKQKSLGCAEIAGGSIVAYEGIKHGLPRTFGLRTEFHTTSKENAKLIKTAGNILDPQFGGKNGWSKKVNDTNFIKNSKNFIHISGEHAPKQIEKNLPEKFKKFGFLARTVYRKIQRYMYKSVGNGIIKNDLENIKNKKQLIKDLIFKNTFKNKTKTFYISAPESYFRNEFIPDPDEIAALKSSKPIKVFSNRFSAMIDGLKKFGLKGMKENKVRVGAGALAVVTGLGIGSKLIHKGIEKFKNVPETNTTLSEDNNIED